MAFDDGLGAIGPQHGQSAALGNLDRTEDHRLILFLLQLRQSHLPRIADGALGYTCRIQSDLQPLALHLNAVDHITHLIPTG